MDNEHKATPKDSGGFAISCTPAGTMERILRDDFKALDETSIGSLSPMLAGRDSMPSALDLITEVKANGAALTTSCR